MTHKPPQRESDVPASSKGAGKPSGLRSLLGYYAVEWRDGYARLELPLGPQHLNSIGSIHGGLVATLLDAALGHAATWCGTPGHARYCVTLSLTTTFLDSTHTGTVHAIGRLIAIDGRTGTCQGELVDAHGRVLAIAQGSFRYSTGSEQVDGVPKRREVVNPQQAAKRRNP